MKRNAVMPTPDGCTCDVVEVGKSFPGSNIKGYATVEECAVCKKIREDNNEIDKAQEAEREKEALIQAKMRELAVSALKAEGKL